MLSEESCLDNTCAKNFFWNIKIRTLLYKRKWMQKYRKIRKRYN